MNKNTMMQKGESSSWLATSVTANPAAKAEVDTDLKTLFAKKRITHKKHKIYQSTVSLLPAASAVISNGPNGQKTTRNDLGGI